MKGQKTQQSKDGGIGNAKKRTKLNQSQEQLIEELHRVIAEKDQLISENNQALIVKDQIIAENAQVMAKNSQVIAENAEVIAKKDRIILRLRMTGAAFMEEAFLRFPHLPEQIFELLNDGSLLSSREVARSWKGFVDYKDYPWTRIQNMVADLRTNCKDDATIHPSLSFTNPFHL